MSCSEPKSPTIRISLAFPCFLMLLLLFPLILYRHVLTFPSYSTHFPTRCTQPSPTLPRHTNAPAMSLSRLGLVRAFAAPSSTAIAAASGVTTAPSSSYGGSAGRSSSRHSGSGSGKGNGNGNGGGRRRDRAPTGPARFDTGEPALPGSRLARERQHSAAAAAYSASGRGGAVDADATEQAALAYDLPGGIDFDALTVEDTSASAQRAGAALQTARAASDFSAAAAAFKSTGKGKPAAAAAAAAAARGGRYDEDADGDEERMPRDPRPTFFDSAVSDEAFATAALSGNNNGADYYDSRDAARGGGAVAAEEFAFDFDDAQFDEEAGFFSDADAFANTQQQQPRRNRALNAQHISNSTAASTAPSRPYKLLEDGTMVFPRLLPADAPPRPRQLTPPKPVVAEEELLARRAERDLQRRTPSAALAPMPTPPRTQQLLAAVPAAFHACRGCGSTLQCEDDEQLGFIPHHHLRAHLERTKLQLDAMRQDLRVRSGGGRGRGTAVAAIHASMEAALRQTAQELEAKRHLGAYTAEQFRRMGLDAAGRALPQAPQLDPESGLPLPPPPAERDYAVVFDHRGAVQQARAAARAQRDNAADPEYMPPVDALGEPVRAQRFSPQKAAGAGAALGDKDVLDVREVKLLEKVAKEAAKPAHCMRCHKLKHAGVDAASVAVLPAEAFVDMLKHEFQGPAAKPSVILKLVDLFDFHGSFIADLHKLAGGRNPVILVANKADLLPKGVGLTRITAWVKREAARYGVPVHSVAVVSAATGLGLDALMQRALKLARGENADNAPRNRDIYVVGTTNVGKSTLVNQLIKMGLVGTGVPTDLSGAAYSRDKLVRSHSSAAPLDATGFDAALLNNTGKTAEAVAAVAAESEALASSTASATAAGMGLAGETVRPPGNTGAALAAATEAASAEWRSELDLDKIGVSAAVIDALVPTKYMIQHHQEQLQRQAQSTTSVIPGTTLGVLSFPIAEKKRGGKNLQLKDTPGVLNAHQLSCYLHYDELKAVLPSQTLRPLTYRVKPGQSLLIGGLARIDVVAGRPFFFTCYLSGKVTVHLTATHNVTEDYLRRNVGTLLSPPFTADRAAALGVFANLALSDAEAEAMRALQAASRREFNASMARAKQGEGAVQPHQQQQQFLALGSGGRGAQLSQQHLDADGYLDRVERSLDAPRSGRDPTARLRQDARDAVNAALNTPTAAAAAAAGSRDEDDVIPVMPGAAARGGRYSHTSTDRYGGRGHQRDMEEADEDEDEDGLYSERFDRDFDDTNNSGSSGAARAAAVRRAAAAAEDAARTAATGATLLPVEAAVDTRSPARSFVDAAGRVVYQLQGAGWSEASHDVVLAGLGWVAVTGAGPLTVRVAMAGESVADTAAAIAEAGAQDAAARSSAVGKARAAAFARRVAANEAGNGSDGAADADDGVIDGTTAATTVAGAAGAALPPALQRLYMRTQLRDPILPWEGLGRASAFTGTSEAVQRAAALQRQERAREEDERARAERAVAKAERRRAAAAAAGGEARVLASESDALAALLGRTAPTPAVAARLGSEMARLRLSTPNHLRGLSDMEFDSSTDVDLGARSGFGSGFSSGADSGAGSALETDGAAAAAELELGTDGEFGGVGAETDFESGFESGSGSSDGEFLRFEALSPSDLEAMEGATASDIAAIVDATAARHALSKAKAQSAAPSVAAAPQRERKQSQRLGTISEREFGEDDANIIASTTATAPAAPAASEVDFNPYKHPEVATPAAALSPQAGRRAKLGTAEDPVWASIQAFHRERGENAATVGAQHVDPDPDAPLTGELEAQLAHLTLTASQRRKRIAAGLDPAVQPHGLAAQGEDGEDVDVEDVDIDAILARASRALAAEEQGVDLELMEDGFDGEALAASLPRDAVFDDDGDGDLGFDYDPRGDEYDSDFGTGDEGGRFNPDDYVVTDPTEIALLRAEALRESAADAAARRAHRDANAGTDGGDHYAEADAASAEAAALSAAHRAKHRARQAAALELNAAKLRGDVRLRGESRDARYATAGAALDPDNVPGVTRRPSNAPPAASSYGNGYGNRYGGESGSNWSTGGNRGYGGGSNNRDRDSGYGARDSNYGGGYGGGNNSGSRNGNDGNGAAPRRDARGGYVADRGADGRGAVYVNKWGSEERGGRRAREAMGLGTAKDAQRHTKYKDAANYQRAVREGRASSPSRSSGGSGSGSGGYGGNSNSSYSGNRDRDRSSDRGGFRGDREQRGNGGGYSNGGSDRRTNNSGGGSRGGNNSRY